MDIPPYHMGVYRTLKKLLVINSDMSGVLIRLQDYDSVQYLISGTPDSILFSVTSPTFAEIEAAGGAQALQDNYSEYLIPPVAQFNCTLQLPLAQIPQGPEQAEVVEQIAVKIAQFRKRFLSGPFVRALTAFRDSTENSPQQFNLRTDQRVWSLPSSDRVTFIFEIIYTDQTDESIAKVFLQEIEEAKRQVQNAPVVAFSQKPPLEIAQQVPQTVGLGYLSITFLRNNLEHISEAAVWLSSFREYTTYHIHACKTYLHMRMRKRTAELLNLIKQALPESDKKFKRTRGVNTLRNEGRMGVSYRK